MLHIYIVS